MTPTESPTQILIGETCRRFLETCGWPLRFRESLPEGLDAADSAFRLWRRALSDGSKTVGELILDLPEDERLDSEFLQMTKAAELIAGLLEEALTAHAAAESSRGDVETLAQMGSALPQQSDLPSALNHLLRAITQLTGFRSFAFFLLDPSGEYLSLRFKHEISSSDVPQRRRYLKGEIPDLAALTGTSLLFRRSLHPAAIKWLPTSVATATCVAVRSEHAPIGTLWAFDRRDRQPDKREIDVIQSIASQLAVVLERAVLLRESESEKRLRRHLRAALDNQPGQELSEPGSECGFESTGVCRSALEIGGDLIELIPLDPERTLIAVGDASGDGVPAAMVMANVRGGVRALAVSALRWIETTEGLVADINRALCGVTPDHQFMSFLLGVFDARSKTFTYTNAGHPAPLHVRGNEIQELESHGMLIGILEDAEYERSTVSLESGDLLVFFSDGVTEAMGRDQQMFRSDGVTGAILASLGRSPIEVFDAIWSRLTQHQRGTGHADDRSLLVLRVK